MKKDPKIFLKHILESIEIIEQYSRDLTQGDFLKSDQLQDAIIRRLEIIGEVVRNIPEEFKNKHPDIPWRKAAGMRDVLIHGYFGVDVVLVWNVVQVNIPQLKKQIKSLL